jgi:hypothetical protein
MIINALNERQQPPSDRVLLRIVRSKRTSNLAIRSVWVRRRRRSSTF